uniref:C-type lectin domain-containing protein n=1 Tax=Amphilophus citrinellus TaxID=61819 RepID=A0A3Q0RWX6_AMPCI
HYVNLQMSWTDAQNYCREKYTDLATIESMEDISRLNRPPLDTTMVWIGLRDYLKSCEGKLKTDTNSWRFSATGQPSKTGFANWAPGYPFSVPCTEVCVTMGPDGRWTDADCAIAARSICCNTAENKKTYVFQPVWRSWPDAQAYCRTHYTDLATIESSEEQTNAYLAKPAGTWAWIGLYHRPWVWSDNSNSSFTNWFNGEPNNRFRNESCVSEDLQHKWFDNDCTMKSAFICHE